MSVAFDEVFPTVNTPRKGPGRPRANLDPARRRQHIGLALIYFGSNWTLSHVAKMHDISPDTARRWIRLALNYQEPEANRVRALAAKSQRKTKCLN